MPLSPRSARTAIALSLPSNSGCSRFSRAHSSRAASALRKEPSCTRTGPPGFGVALGAAPKMAAASFTADDSFAAGAGFDGATGLADVVAGADVVVESGAGAAGAVAGDEGVAVSFGGEVGRGIGCSGPGSSFSTGGPPRFSL